MLLFKAFPNSHLPNSLKIDGVVVVFCQLMEDHPQAQDQPQEKTKAYETPTLVGYGDLVEVTRSFGNMGTTDNAIVGQNHKTG